MKTGKELPEPDMKGAHGNVIEEGRTCGRRRRKQPRLAGASLLASLRRRRRGPW